MPTLKRRTAAVRLLAKLDQQIQEAQTIASSPQLTPVERRRAVTQQRVFEKLAQRMEKLLSSWTAP
jgi:hypothetical protein